jgi:hypothetical protein
MKSPFFKTLNKNQGCTQFYIYLLSQAIGTTRKFSNAGLKLNRSYKISHLGLDLELRLNSELERL